MINIKLQAKIYPSHAILRLVKETARKHDRGCNIEELSLELDLSRPTVSRHCHILASSGKISRKELGRNVIFYV